MYNNIIKLYKCHFSETRQRCSTHLINEGVIVEEGMVSIMTQVVGPSSNNRLAPQFECRVDSNRRRDYSPCKLTFI